MFVQIKGEAINLAFVKRVRVQDDFDGKSCLRIFFVDSEDWTNVYPHDEGYYDLKAWMVALPSWSSQLK